MGFYCCRSYREEIFKYIDCLDDFRLLSRGFSLMEVRPLVVITGLRSLRCAEASRIFMWAVCSGRVEEVRQRDEWSKAVVAVVSMCWCVVLAAVSLLLYSVEKTTGWMVGTLWLFWWYTPVSWFPVLWLIPVPGCMLWSTLFFIAGGCYSTESISLTIGSSCSSGVSGDIILIWSFCTFP
jgi:hypothetical protein